MTPKKKSVFKWMTDARGAMCSASGGYELVVHGEVTRTYAWYVSKLEKGACVTLSTGSQCPTLASAKKAAERAFLDAAPHWLPEMASVKEIEKKYARLVKVAKEATELHWRNCWCSLCEELNRIDQEN